VLQRVAFPVAGTAIEGMLHLPDGETLGGVAVLPGRGGTMEQSTYLGESLAAAGIAALRFTFRIDSDPIAGLADTGGAVRLLRSHPAIPQRIGLLGWSFGGAVAAMTAGRDSRIRAAAVLTQARVRHQVVTIPAADHNFTQPAARAEMLAAVTTWLREALAAQS
jgi:dienelactone hydrolase